MTDATENPAEASARGPFRVAPSPAPFRAPPVEESSGPSSFRALVGARLPAVVIILLLGLALRLAFVFLIPLPNSAGGDPRYTVTAANLLAGHGFSMGIAPPFGPSAASVPVYPLFVAAVYALGGRRPEAVRVAQAALDLLTCLLVAYVSFRLAPPRLRERAALATLAVYALCSWFTLVWVTCLLTETLSLFLTMLTITLCSLALRDDARKGYYWAGAGLTCGLAALTRPDSLLLLAAVLLFLLSRAALRRSSEALTAALIFAAAFALTLAPWTLRNYRALGMFQPLASEYGCVGACRFPTGYLFWLRTWLTDETHFAYVFDPAWSPETTYFDPARLPAAAYDSEAERQQIVGLIARYNQARSISPEVDEGFRRLALGRIRRAPFRFFLGLPLRRAASMWLTGFSTSRPKPYVLLLRILSVLPLIVGGVLGLAVWCRRRPLAALLALVMLVRTAFFGFHYAPETRYIVEAYPPMIAACGVTLAALWLYLRDLKLRRGSLK